MGTANVTLLSGATATGAGPWHNVADYKSVAAFMAFVTAGNATVTIDVSNDPGEPKTHILSAGVGTLSPTSTTPDAIKSGAPLVYVRANVTAIAGGGAVTVQMTGEH